MKPERDPWTEVLDAWRRDSPLEEGLELDESVPMGFATRVVARWQAEDTLASSSWVELWEKCAIPGAFAAVLGLLALVAFDSASGDSHDSAVSGLFVIPDIDLPGQLK